MHEASRHHNVFVRAMTLHVAVGSSGEQWGAVGSSGEQSGAVGSSGDQSGAVRSSQGAVRSRGEQSGAVESSGEQSGAVRSSEDWHPGKQVYNRKKASRQASTHSHMQRQTYHGGPRPCPAYWYARMLEQRLELVVLTLDASGHLRQPQACAL